MRSILAAAKWAGKRLQAGGQKNKMPFFAM